MENENLGTRDNILRAAMAEFLDKGFQGASLRQIVKNAGVTTGAFYGYFSSKEALFNALWSHTRPAPHGQVHEGSDRFCRAARGAAAGAHGGRILPTASTGWWTTSASTASR